jgi:hypothetical protein
MRKLEFRPRNHLDSRLHGDVDPLPLINASLYLHAFNNAGSEVVMKTYDGSILSRGPKLQLPVGGLSARPDRY